MTDLRYDIVLLRPLLILTVGAKEFRIYSSAPERAAVLAQHQLPHNRWQDALVNTYHEKHRCGSGPVWF